MDYNWEGRSVRLAGASGDTRVTNPHATLRGKWDPFEKKLVIHAPQLPR